ncbi:MAG: hypothetical protein JSW11_09235 [Candidatus Heimdallarchaeota archaeon]|nr:MAG: hypothetical protein JSW11_09235 [Candidatus Heimdallarchaeota archaeon]
MEIPLNGEWKYLVDSESVGINNTWWKVEWISAHFKSLKQIILPNNWNIVPELDRYEGIVWFFYLLEFHENINNFKESDIFLQFKAVNYDTRLWINGVKCGDHQGNFLPFSIKIEPNLINKKNYIAVRVENLRKRNRIPTRSRDWFNWGGIYRDISLCILEKTRIGWVGVKTIIHERSATIELNYELTTLKRRQIDISWKLLFLGNISTQKRQKKDPILVDSGIIFKNHHLKRGSFSLTVEEAKIWSIDDPQLYQVQLSLQGSHELYVTRFGIRDLKIVGHILFLNDKPVSMRGVCLHEELVLYGRAIPRRKRRKDIINIKKLGFNALRTGHYPHDEMIYDICDEEGLLVLEEIPVYWGIDFSDKQVFKLAVRMLKEMIRRDFNHPSIISWSTGNEVPVLNKDCVQFMTALTRYCKSLDNSRLITFVLEFWSALIAPKEVIEEVDILCINQYIGWYYLSVYNLNLFLDSLHQRFTNKIVFITEFGAGGKFGYHDSSKLPKKYSEERQAAIISHSIKVMNSKTYIKGWFIWIYRDFRSHMRLNKFQEGYNRKGIVSEKNEMKLIAKNFPRLASKKFEKNQIKQHRKLAALFYVAFYPIIRIMAIIITQVLIKFSDSGDKFYAKELMD